MPRSGTMTGGPVNSDRCSAKTQGINRPVGAFVLQVIDQLFQRSVVEQVKQRLID